ncbi:cytochrome P450 CYP570A1 [Pestalotiopsis sp. NC0098]|nr:cytochrome P450 CYP570A1 [Pestalotiopsis sp. NC0098]
MGLWDLVVLSAALGVVYRIVVTYNEWQQLRHIPGPFFARFTRFWLVSHILKGYYIDLLVELHEKYGPVVVLAPDFVSLSDPAEIKSIGGVRSPWGRSMNYQAFRFSPGPAGDSVLSMRDDRAHARMRAKLMPGYAGRTVEGVELMVDKHVAQLVDIVGARYVTTPGADFRPADLSVLAQYLTIDVITSFAFQESFACMERDADFHGYLASVGKSVPYLLSFSIFPVFAYLMGFSALNRIFPDGGFFPKVFEMARRQVGKRYGRQEHELKEGNDVLGTWVAAGLGAKELENEVIGQLVAGGETTSTGIRSALLYLMTSPGTYRTLQDEVDAALRDGRVTACPPPEAEVSRLPYLQAVVKESLRLFTPAGFFPKSSPNDETLCGLKIPAGVAVEPAYKPALQNKEIYGNDAAFFRPERWLEAEPAKLKLMDETNRFVFGGPSRWECLGKGLAFMQMHKVIFELMRHFDLSLVDPAKPWKATGTRIWVIEDFFAQITKRSPVKQKI